MRTVTFKKHTSLIEGVHNGFTFSLLDDNDVSMHTQAQCKDYFQDLWWAENTGKNADVWGFTWKPGTIPLDVPSYRFALRESGSQYDLSEKMPQVAAFLHHFETALGYKPLSTWEPTSEHNVVILTFPAGWTKYNPMVSALTTIIRLGLMYEGGDPVKMLEAKAKEWESVADKFSYGKPVQGFYNATHADMGRINTVLPRLKALLKGKEAKPAWSKFPSGHSAHEGGIIGYKDFPEVK